ncbi:biotin--[acetyl-CoA-carboxylase] ligase [Aquincola sp. S2]|uniref:biotin--[biotin carboxyl-carrier protein] ligase n=1 Tax=Pseudaquabacterium terrae TaxID=2732868 RepID=A0ABX2EDI3_9BURK|nr:biotin--[acetyl-CoA-carboxylase] ligase [Aquabacterium terrae]NRF66212.1 biotin--[acetyl-CoA-carboxylase] ligase [Aquabacterium terrae]
MSDTHHLQWGAETLWQRLTPLLPGLSVEMVARIDSTNTQLLERARRAGAHDDAASASTHGRRAGDTQPCLLVAESQTRGRGRQGKPWYSTAGASLTFSLSLPLKPPDWSGLSLAVGIAVADALDPLGAGQAPRIGLKWPNDLMLLESDGPGRKLGGILIETVPVGQRRMAVIGIGLNVLPQALKDLSWGYACLQEFLPAIDAPQALAQVAEPLVRLLLDFERHGFAPLQPRYARRDALLGKPVTTSFAEAPEGVAEGVDADGALLLRVGTARQRITSGEVVSVRLVGDHSGDNSDDDAGDASENPEAPAC